MLDFGPSLFSVFALASSVFLPGLPLRPPGLIFAASLTALRNKGENALFSLGGLILDCDGTVNVGGVALFCIHVSFFGSAFAAIGSFL